MKSVILDRFSGDKKILTSGNDDYFAAFQRISNLFHACGCWDLSFGCEHDLSMGDKWWQCIFLMWSWRGEVMIQEWWKKTLQKMLTTISWPPTGFLNDYNNVPIVDSYRSRQLLQHVWVVAKQQTGFREVLSTVAFVQQWLMSAATPGVLTTSNNASSVTWGSSFNRSARGWPMPPLAPSTATLKFLTPDLETARVKEPNMIGKFMLKKVLAGCQSFFRL